jgi:serine protease
MQRAHFLVRITLAVVTLSALGVTAMTPTSATAGEARLAHPGRVIYPTVASANAQRGANSTNLVLSAHGGVDGVEVTTGTPKVYVVFYGSQWGTQTANTSAFMTFSGDPAGMALRLQELLAGIGTNGELWSGVVTQYCDGVASGATSCPSGATHVGYPTGGALAGVWYDNSVAAPTQASGYQLAAEAVRAAGHFANTTAALNRSAQYVIVSPTGTHPDGFNTPSGQFCAYHDYNGDTTLSGGAAPSNYGDIAFTNLPYVTDMGSSCGANYVNAGSAGALDGVSIVEGHEYAETLSDQNPGGGWWDNKTGDENGDACAWVGTGGTGGAQNVSFATGSFAMQATWSNSNHSCEISGPIVTTQAPGNDFSLALSSASGAVVQGSSLTTTVTTSTTSGSAQSVALSVSGLPTGAQATFTPASVTSGGSSTLSILTSSTTPTGSYSLSVTGTATSGSHSATYSLVVNSPVTPGTFSIAATPSSGTANPGHSVSTTVATVTTSSASQVLALSISALPSGVTASFTPASLTSGASSRLTLSVARHVRAGTYTLTITATGASSTATTTYTLTD